MNKKTVTIIVGVVLVAVSFYGGMVYGQSKPKTLTRGNFMGANQTGQVSGDQNGFRGGVAGGFVNGEIISKDSTGITIKLQNGGSQIVLVSVSTPITKSASGTINDLSVGTQVMVTGTTNTDKSMTAKSIQIRPATTTRAY